MQMLIVDEDETLTLMLTMTVAMILTADYSTHRQQFVLKIIFTVIIYSKVQTWLVRKLTSRQLDRQRVGSSSNSPVTHPGRIRGSMLFLELNLT